MALVESSHPEQFRLRWALLHSAPAPALRSRRRFGLRACRSGPRKRVGTDRPQDARDDPRGGLFGGRRRWRPWAVGHPRRLLGCYRSLRPQPRAGESGCGGRGRSGDCGRARSRKGHRMNARTKGGLYNAAPANLATNPGDPQEDLVPRNRPRGWFLSRGVSPDLIHDFASLFGTTTYSVWLIEPWRRIPRLEGCSGNDSCSIVDAKFAEFTFHALR